MSLGRLLAAGKSLVGGQECTGRYRVNKHLTLPKFISPRNPFVSSSKLNGPLDDLESSDLICAGKAVVATAKADPAGAEKGNLQISMVARATRWLEEWRQKLNPLPRLAKRPGPVKSALPHSISIKTPVQPELSLDQVKVVRNDLSDADLEVVPVKTPLARLPARPAEKLAFMADTWGRLTTKLFGAGPR